MKKSLKIRLEGKLKKFKKDKKIGGGTRDHPYYVDVGEYKCIECKVDADEISRKSQRSSQYFTGRGKFNYDWEIITYQCPKCKRTEKHETEAIESDGSYYSNEERRVYGTD